MNALIVSCSIAIILALTAAVVTPKTNFNKNESYIKDAYIASCGIGYYTALQDIQYSGAKLSLEKVNNRCLTVISKVLEKK